MVTAAEQRERDLPILRSKPQEFDAVVLLAGDGWRIVRTTGKDDGVIADILEAVDGYDLLGAPRWFKVEGRDAVSTYVRVQRALVEHITKGLV